MDWVWVPGTQGVTGVMGGVKHVLDTCVHDPQTGTDVAVAQVEVLVSVMFPCWPTGQTNCRCWVDGTQLVPGGGGVITTGGVDVVPQVLDVVTHPGHTSVGQEAEPPVQVDVCFCVIDPLWPTGQESVWVFVLGLQAQADTGGTIEAPWLRE